MAEACPVVEKLTRMHLEFPQRGGLTLTLGNGALGVLGISCDLGRRPIIAERSRLLRGATLHVERFDNRPARR